MRETLHIVAPDASADALEQLRLLAPDAEAVSVGPAPTRGGGLARVRGSHVPLNWPRLWAARAQKRPVFRLPLGGRGRLDTKANLLHAWSPRSFEAAWHLAQRTHQPMLYSLQGADADRSLWPRARRPFVHLSVPSEAAKQRLARIGLDAARVHVLPPCTALADPTAGTRRQIRTHLGLAEADLLIVSPAEMTRNAGHKYASWSHAIVRQLLENLRLAFPGGGPAEPRVRYFAGTTGYDAEVFFTENRFKTSDLLAAGDIACFLPVRDSGLWPVAAAMAAGTPLIATRTPDICCYARDGENALLVAPADPRAISAALLKLSEDPELREKLARAGRAFAEAHFSPDVARGRLAEIIRAILRTP